MYVEISARPPPTRQEKERGKLPVRTGLVFFCSHVRFWLRLVAQARMGGVDVLNDMGGGGGGEVGGNMFSVIWPCLEWSRSGGNNR